MKQRVPCPKCARLVGFVWPSRNILANHKPSEKFVGPVHSVPIIKNGETTDENKFICNGSGMWVK